MDDSPYNLFVLEEMLLSMKNSNFTIDKALNGLIAKNLIVEKFKEEKISFDLIFIDLNMPIMDGIETVKILEELENEG